MPLMRIAEGCTAGRAPAGATWQEREALLDRYDVVLVSLSLMITRLSRMSKLTAGTVTTAMTDQYGGHLGESRRGLAALRPPATWTASSRSRPYR